VATPAARAPRRGSSLALALLAALALALLAALAHAAWVGTAAQVRVQQARAVVRALDLTDMAWFPEARYTRHPSQADLHSAYQDAPGALEHYPAGTLLAPAMHRSAAASAAAPAPR
jgi:hypothetical protein